MPSWPAQNQGTGSAKVVPNRQALQGSSHQPPKKILIIVFLAILVLVGLLVASKYLKSLKPTGQPAAVEQDLPQVSKVENLIALVANPPREFLDIIDEQLWQIQKNGLLEGSGYPDKELSGLNDVRAALKRREVQTAKNLMDRNLFRRLSAPLPAKNKQDEPIVELDENEINSLDPQRNFFFPLQQSAKVSKARYDAIILFLELYYSL